MYPVSAPPIGVFQLNNILKSRVPFCLLNFGVDLNSSFDESDQFHLRTYQIEIALDMSEQQIVDLLKSKKIPEHYPLVFICTNGDHSKKMATALESQGWINSYYVLGGLLGLNAL